MGAQALTTVPFGPYIAQFIWSVAFGAVTCLALRSISSKLYRTIGHILLWMPCAYVILCIAGIDQYRQACTEIYREVCIETHGGPEKLAAFVKMPEEEKRKVVADLVEQGLALLAPNGLDVIPFASNVAEAIEDKNLDLLFWIDKTEDYMRRPTWSKLLNPVYGPYGLLARWEMAVSHFRRLRTQAYAVGYNPALDR